MSIIEKLFHTNKENSSDKEDKNMKPNIEELRKKYMDHPPEGFTSEDIRNMSEDELLDMDYFLNEDDLFSDEAGVEGFYIF